MARRKQSLPARANGAMAQKVDSYELKSDGLENNSGELSSANIADRDWLQICTHACGVEIYSPVTPADCCVDVAEISLENMSYKASLSPAELESIEYENGEHLTVRLRLYLERDCIAGRYDVSSEDVRVEICKHYDDHLYNHMSNSAGKEHLNMIASGGLYGSDASISALVYLFKAGYVSMGPYLESRSTVTLVKLEPSCRLRISICQKAFDGCDGLLDSAKYAWRRNMLKVMEWLRPDLHTDEAIYGVMEHQSKCGSPKNHSHPLENFEQEQDAGSQASFKEELFFDPSGLYEAMKPDLNGSLLNLDLPQLCAKLRPYQSRAAHWMVNREKNLHADSEYDSADNYSSSVSCGLKSNLNIKSPFCKKVESMDGKSAFYYNPFSGCVSWDPCESFPDVRGGILADEMGLGKTVELLACILANPCGNLLPGEPGHKPVERASKELHRKMMERKGERIDCPCGATDDDSYDGLWVQCDCCDVWQHVSCVGLDSQIEEHLWQEWCSQSSYRQHLQRTREQKKRKTAEGMTPSVEMTTLHVRHLNAQRTKEKKRRKLAGGDTSSPEEIVTVEENFICGTCASLIGSVEVDGVCAATLIVCPTQILGQWQDEIARHIRKDALKVIVYDGVQQGSSTSGHQLGEDARSSKQGKIVGAHELAAADIVLTTYDTLRADLSHDVERNDESQRAMRFRKRYPVVPTPLTRLHWWRVCLDEAQMVESNSARATEMALRLHSQIRWCISGTPIQRSLDDLYGLLRFLGSQPFDDYFWWSKVIKEPYEKRIPGGMHFTCAYLRTLMWRSSKVHVSHELGLPPQEESLTWLRFSPIEAHFYKVQHDRCAKKAMEVMTGSSQSNKEHGFSSVLQTFSERNNSYDRQLTSAEAAKVINPLLSLRQACCHPQVGSSGLRSLQKSPMTMDEVLKVLIEKAKTEGEEAERSLLGALNGLAALALLEQEIPAAIKIYREALSIAEENADDFRVDPLQKLHILHNLGETLKIFQKKTEEECNIDFCYSSLTTNEMLKSYSSTMKEMSEAGCTVDTLGNASEKNHVLTSKGASSSASEIPRTLRDDSLEQECQVISAKYMSSFYAKLSAARQEYKNIRDQVCSYLKELKNMKGMTWWLDALASLPNASKQAKELVQKIKESLLEKDALALSRQGHENASSLALRFGDINGLKYILSKEIEAIFHYRQKLDDRMSEIDAMMDNPNAEVVERAVHCSVCDFGQKGPSCAHCEMDKLFQMYENRLFLLRSSAANVGEVVALEDAFLAQQRLLMQKRVSTFQTATGSCGYIEDNLSRNRHNQALEIARTQVSRSPSETENILRIIKSYMKQRMSGDGADSSRKHLDAFEAMRKEFAQARMLAVSQRMILFALDELNMATTRLRFKFPGEESSNATDELFKLHPEEIPQRNAQLTGDKYVAYENFCLAKGQLRYLKGLAIARERVKERQDSEKCNAISQLNDTESVEQGRAITLCDKTSVIMGSSEQENCPVCHETLGMQMMILPCGHMLCCRCMMTIADRAQETLSGAELKRVMCPSCRYRTHLGNIAFIDNGSDVNSHSKTMSTLQDEEKHDESSLQVNGSYGTKMEAVTKRILRIKRTDPDAKFLVFSSWNDVLDVVEHTLSANSISYVRAKGRRNLDTAIRKFKGKGLKGSDHHDQDIHKPVQVLLLLIQQGANGLNLVEAQHVILIEPLLNQGSEAQAVNRVHRIGQHHVTYVHKFLIKDTVEESIYKLSQLKAHSQNGTVMKRSRNNQEISTLTVNDLNLLFKTETDDCNQHVQNNLSKGVLPDTSLRHLPPSVAAAVAAEARQKQVRQDGTQ